MGEPLSTASRVLLPKFLVGRSDWTKVSATTVPTAVAAGRVVVVVVDVVGVVAVVVVVGPGAHGQAAVTATSGLPAVASWEL